VARFIAITGTHSTGKSTFLQGLETALLEQTPDLRVARVSDKASDCRDAGFPILRDHTVDSTLWIMASVIRGELEAALHADVVLVDRPVSDALGYLEAAHQSRGDAIPKPGREYLYTLARLHSRRYDVVVRTVLDSSIPLGPGRDTDSKFRALVDERIEAVVGELGMASIEMRSSGVDERAAEVLGFLAS